MFHHAFFSKSCHCVLRHAALLTPLIIFLVPLSATPLFAEADHIVTTSARYHWQSLLDDRTAELAAPTAGQQTPTRSKQASGKLERALGRWELADQEEFAEHGKVHIDQGILTLEQGYPATGVRLRGPFPKSNYEIQLEAKRTDGGDFFCGLTFPVGEGSLTLILGGWGGWAVGLSCIDGDYAIDNETLTVVQFQQDRWYSVRMRVIDPLIEVWIDKKQVIQLKTKGKELLISDRMEPCLPLGLATWHTTGAIRKIRYRVLEKK